MLPLSENELDELVARERERGAPPLTDWDSLAERLRAEGLIKEKRFGGSSGSGGFAPRVWMQAAAALAARCRRRCDRTLHGARCSDRQHGVAISANRRTLPRRRRRLQESGTPPLPRNTVPEFRSPEEAWDVLNRAGEEYQRASAYLSASNTEVPMPTNPDTYRTRLAALDNVMTEMRSALNEAPHDPVINQYYLATVGAREATLRQLGTTLPAGARLNRF